MRKVTNIFKAQFGGGTEQADSAKMMTQSIYSAIKKGQTPKQVYEALIARKVSQDMALQLVTSVVNFMMQNGELEQKDLEEQEKEEAQAAQQKAEEEAALRAQMEADKDAEAEAEMNQYNEQSLEAANEDPGYDEEAQTILGFQEGGGLDIAAMYSQMQEQAPDATKGMDSLIAATTGTQSISFPGIEEYVYPYMPLYNGNTDFDPSLYAKYGGSANKRKFTKNVMGLLKKAEGGEDEVLNDTTASQFDTLDGEVKKKQSSFVNAVGEQAKKLKIEEWFNKLQETGDPMLEQLTNPAPEVPNPTEEQMQRGGSKQNKKYQRLLRQANKALNINEMPGTLGLPIDYYNKFAPGFRDQRFNTIDSEDLSKFIGQQKEVSVNPSKGYMPYIDVYESGFFGRPKKYRIGYTPVGIQPVDKSSEQQAEEATAKNNKRYITDPGYKDSPAPEGTMLDLIENVSVKPISFGSDWRTEGTTAFGVTPNSQIATPILMGQPQVTPEVTTSNAKIIGNAKVIKKGRGSQSGYVQYEIQVPGPNGQMFSIQTEFNREPTEADIQEILQSTTEKETGGIVGSGDPSVPALSEFVYGGMDFPEESKNTNDPYFTDTYPMQMAQQGGDPTEFTHYTHGADDIFHDQMNMMVAQNGAEVQAFDPSQMYNLDYLKTLVKDLKHEDRLARKDDRRAARATNSTLRDYLLPVNPMFRYSGSWAEQVGMPYEYGTGNVFAGSLDNAQLATRDVTDRGILGRPKAWTDYYILNADGEPAFDLNQHPMLQKPRPEQEQNIENVQDEEQSDLGLRARMAVNRGERKSERQRERAERKGYQIGGEPEDNFYDQLEENLYNPIEEYRRGGRLRRASMGMANTSVAYNDNPIFNNGLDPNVVLGDQSQIAPVQTPDYWSNMNGTQTQFNPPQQPTDQIAIDQVDQAQGTVQQKQDPITAPLYDIVGVDRRRQDMRTFDPEAMLNAGNAASRGVLGLLNRKEDREQEREMYDTNFDPMNIYGKKERMDRGDWEVNQGSYRMNQTGADRLGRSKQYGGQAFDEGEELYMTEEEIREFLANGGQLEYL